MDERSEIAALGIIVAALAIVALSRSEQAPPPPPIEGAASAHVTAQVARAAPAPEALAALREGRPLDLNCVDAATLELLPGVGPALARRIVEHRQSNGLFDSVEALDRVHGVGPKTLGRIRPLLAIRARPAGQVTCPTSTTTRP